MTINSPEIVTEFPQTIREINNTFITLGDGCKLAARIWLPEAAEQNPVPAILEYLPYRKRDGTAVRDALTHPYFAGHGYASVRVDMRGNGESDGVMLDEYVKQEQDDALAVIDWLTQQDWCDGNVGMMGISWGGFNGLQVAALNPEPLKAIITLCSTDDRYADDIHYKGGAMLMENPGWASTMFSFSSRPPDPALVGERWRDMWMQRLEATPLLIENWLKHQHRDAYWKQGSVCENFSQIKAAVYAIGGWGDAYSNAIPRMVEGLTSPVKALTGPWIHKYPHFAIPEPRMGFLQEAVTWWDHWLKGKDTGIMDEPVYRVYMMESAPPVACYTMRSGRWVAENVWPSENIQNLELHIGNDGLTYEAQAATSVTVCSPETTGVAGGEYCAMWAGPELPTEQRFDDANSVCFDTDVLYEPIEIFGAPVVTLNLTSDRPQANIAIRLCDVHTDGRSTRITFGILNLCHRDSHEYPEALEPGQQYTIQIKLDDIAYAMPTGHKLRLAISTAYWPMIWPSPEKATLTLDTESSTLLLPVHPAYKQELREFEPAVTAQPLALETLRQASNERRVEYDLASGDTVMHINDDFGEHKDLTHGLITGGSASEAYSIHPDDPACCKADIKWTQTLKRDDWSVRTETHTVMWSDKENFYVKANLRAFEADNLVLQKDWHTSVRRDLV